MKDNLKDETIIKTLREQLFLPDEKSKKDSIFKTLSKNATNYTIASNWKLFSWAKLDGVAKKTILESYLNTGTQNKSIKFINNCFNESFLCLFKDEDKAFINKIYWCLRIIKEDDLKNTRSTYLEIDNFPDGSGNYDDEKTIPYRIDVSYYWNQAKKSIEDDRTTLFFKYIGLIDIKIRKNVFPIDLHNKSGELLLELTASASDFSNEVNDREFMNNVSWYRMEKIDRDHISKVLYDLTKECQLNYVKEIREENKKKKIQKIAEKRSKDILLKQKMEGFEFTADKNFINTQLMEEKKRAELRFLKEKKDYERELQKEEEQNLKIYKNFRLIIIIIIILFIAGSIFN